MNEKKALEGEDLFTGVKPVLQGRKKLAERVANGGGWGKTVRDHILRHEVLWITKHQIVEPKTGSHSRIIRGCLARHDSDLKSGGVWCTHFEI